MFCLFIKTKLPLLEIVNFFGSRIHIHIHRLSQSVLSVLFVFTIVFPPSLSCVSMSGAVRAESSRGCSQVMNR